MGLKRKFAALRSLRPDIAVLSEVACPEKLRDQVYELCDVPIVLETIRTRASRFCRSLATGR